MKKVVLSLLATLFLAGGLLQQPAGALDQGTAGEISPSHTHLRKNYPPIAGIYPVQSGAHPFSAFRPAGCAAQTYCDRVVFNIQYPEGFLRSLRGTDYVSFGVRVTLTWPDPKNNDLDLFVWPDDDPAFGGPVGVCATPADKKCETLYPEVFEIVEASHDPDDPETKEDESKKPIPIYMSVVNDGGTTPNTGYTLDFQWFLIKQGELPDFKPPEIGGASQQRPVTASQTPAPFLSRDNSEKELPKILVPGPDGKLRAQGLNFYAAGNRVKPAHSGTSSWVWITAAAIAGLALLVFAYLVWQRRRQEALG